MKILFLDIETCPEYEHFSELSEAGQEAYTKKYGKSAEFEAIRKTLVTQEPMSPVVKATLDRTAISMHYAQWAALYPEFARIVCIGIGTIVPKSSGGTPEAEVVPEDKIVTKIIDGEEVDILKKFADICEGMGSDLYLVAHNGELFDYPFIIRRMMIKKVKLPIILRIIGKSPWNLTLWDTVKMWRATNYKDYVSLITLCYVFGIESPKQEITGAEVPAAFRAGRIKEIGEYCLRDVVALINCYRCMVGEEVILKVVESKK